MKTAHILLSYFFKIHIHTIYVKVLQVASFIHMYKIHIIINNIEKET
jgi:hypothetical protein